MELRGEAAKEQDHRRRKIETGRSLAVGTVAIRQQLSAGSDSPANAAGLALAVRDGMRNLLMDEHVSRGSARLRGKLQDEWAMQAASSRPSSRQHMIWTRPCGSEIQFHSDRTAAIIRGETPVTREDVVVLGAAERLCVRVREPHESAHGPDRRNDHARTATRWPASAATCGWP